MVEPVVEPEQEPLPNPDEPVIDDTEKDKELIEDITEVAEEIIDHSNAVVPNGHITPPAKTDPIPPTIVDETETEESTDVWQIVGLIAIALIFILIAVYSVVKCRRRCGSQKPIAQNEDPLMPSNQSRSNSGVRSAEEDQTAYKSSK